MVAVLTSCPCVPRRKVFLLLGALALFTVIIFSIADSRLVREDMLDLKLADMQEEIHYLKSMYWARQEEIMEHQLRLKDLKENHLGIHHTTTLRPEVAGFLKTMNGTRLVTGLMSKTQLRIPFIYQLLPHLMDHPDSLRPAYHLKGSRNFSEYVFGIPTVRRDKERYLVITLEHLLEGLKDYQHSTLIVIFVGETDLEYVLNVAQIVESKFPRYVANGMIEIISPSTSYYPDFSQEKPTLGDSVRRFRWRTKQNLDAIFLMAYAQTKGTYYLMLEDDIICKPTFMDSMKKYTTEISLSQPDWVFIEYCPIGGIGKLFKSSKLMHFIAYLQLFYRNMPIDWILEKYLENNICSYDMSTKDCAKTKLKIRPKYSPSLFQHIGLYSSLKGKIQKIKDAHFGNLPKFYPHTNPPLESAETTIKVYGDWNLMNAYLGVNFFWGITPKKGDTVEFRLKKPMYIESFLFRSGNVEHVSDKFLHTVVEVTPFRDEMNVTQVGSFDEFGLAEGTISKDLGPICAIRLKVEKDLVNWAILSEIYLYSPPEDQKESALQKTKALEKTQVNKKEVES